MTLKRHILLLPTEWDIASEQKKHPFPPKKELKLIFAIHTVGHSFCSIFLELLCVYSWDKKISNYVRVSETGIFGVGEGSIV